MCQFCVQHGDGKRWYRNARNYALDLESDLLRRGYVVSFVRDFERTRRRALAGLGALRYLPSPIRDRVAEGISRRRQEVHFGQPVPLEQCEQMLALATHITRLPCVCRGAMRRGSDSPSCCIVATVTPHDALLAECFAPYAGGRPRKASRGSIAPARSTTSAARRSGASPTPPGRSGRPSSRPSATATSPAVASPCACSSRPACASCGAVRTWRASRPSAAAAAGCASSDARSAPCAAP